MLFKKFKSAVIPAMISFFLSGIYVSIDGLLVGNAVGDLGLAAINIAWPLVAIILALGTGLGMGGSIHMSLNRGRGNIEKAESFQGNTLILLIIASLVTTITLYLGSEPLLSLLGARDQVLTIASEYVKILAFGSIFQIAGQGANPLLRNQGKAWTAMALMILNFLLDTSLSWLFTLVLNYGVKGAAIASVLGQGLAFIPILYLLFTKNNRIPLQAYVLKKTHIKSIISAGLSPFALSFIPALTILMINLQAAKIGGTTAVASFAVLGYIFSVGQLLLQGISDGAQPLLSYEYGAGNMKNASQIKKMTYITAVSLAFLIWILASFARDIIPTLFNTSAESASILHLAIPIFLSALPFYAITRVTTAIAYAQNNLVKSNLMVYGEVLIVLPVLTILLPQLFGLMGVWLVVPLTQFFLVGLAFMLNKIVRKKSQN
ncbi:TPA: MATE family efflux transporter [Streptococcus suis]